MEQSSEEIGRVPIAKPTENTIATESTISIPINEIMRFIFNQPDLDLSNPEHQQYVLSTLKVAQQLIRGKYGLPPLEMLKNDPAEYERQLREIARRRGVTIHPTIEFGTFFKENRTAEGVYFEETSKIGVDIKKRGDINEYIRGLRVLEHELIHALQGQRMPIEIAEYEAYAAHFNIPYLTSQPADLQLILDFFIGGSVRNYYRRTGETPPYLNQNS